MSRSPEALAVLSVVLAPLVTATIARAQELPPLPAPSSATSISTPTPTSTATSTSTSTRTATPPQPAADVRFEPAAPNLRLFTLTGEAPFARGGWFYQGWWYERGYLPIYSRVCDGPCTTRFEPGEYQLALAKGFGPPVPAREGVIVRGPSILRGSYTDRSALRAAGLAVGMTGLVGGIVMIIASAQREEVCPYSGYCYARDTANGPLLVSGVGVVVVSAVVATVLALQHDEAHVTVEPR